MQTPALPISKQRMSEFCRRWKIQELALFGSVLREDYSADSDVDILVAFTGEATWGLLDHLKMERELATLFGREVDLISKRAVEQSHNWIRRQEILDSAQVVVSDQGAVYATR